MAALQEPDADVDKEVDMMEVDPDAKEMAKTGWPEMEKDAAPSSLCVPAGRCVQRNLKKVGDLLKRFQLLPAEHQSKLQAGPAP